MVLMRGCIAKDASQWILTGTAKGTQGRRSQWMLSLLLLLLLELLRMHLLGLLRVLLVRTSE